MQAQAVYATHNVHACKLPTHRPGPARRSSGQLLQTLLSHIHQGLLLQRAICLYIFFCTFTQASLDCCSQHIHGSRSLGVLNQGNLDTHTCTFHAHSEASLCQTIQHHLRDLFFEQTFPFRLAKCLPGQGLFKRSCFNF